MKRLLRKELSVHIFTDIETLERVTQVIIKRGKYTGKNNYEYTNRKN